MNKESIKSKENQSFRVEGTASAYFNLVLWGCLLCLFYVLHYFAKILTPLETIRPFLFFIFPIGSALTIIYGRKKLKNKPEVIDNTRMLIYCWAGIGLCLSIWLINSEFYNIDIHLACSTLLIGFAALVTGATIKSMKAIVGGVLCILLSTFIPTLVNGFQYHVAAVAVLVSCWIPGILWYSKHFKKQKKTKTAKPESKSEESANNL